MGFLGEEEIQHVAPAAAPAQEIQAVLLRGSLVDFVWAQLYPTITAPIP